MAEVSNVLTPDTTHTHDEGVGITLIAGIWNKNDFDREFPALVASAPAGTEERTRRKETSTHTTADDGTGIGTHTGAGVKSSSVIDTHDCIDIGTTSGIVTHDCNLTNTVSGMSMDMGDSMSTGSGMSMCMDELNDDERPASTNPTAELDIACHPRPLWQDSVAYLPGRNANPTNIGIQPTQRRGRSAERQLRITATHSARPGEAKSTHVRFMNALDVGYPGVLYDGGVAIADRVGTASSSCGGAVANDLVRGTVNFEQSSRVEPPRASAAEKRRAKRQRQQQEKQHTAAQTVVQ